MAVSTLRPEPAPDPDGLVIDQAGEILQIRLDRPAARNALTPAMYLSLIHI